MQLIVSVQLVYFLSFIPVPVSFLYQCVGLRIYPLIIDRCAIIQCNDGGGEETPVPAYVLQTLAIIRTGNEGCMPYEIVCLHVVCFPLRHTFLCDDPFQPCQIAYPGPFEFFHIDDEVRAEQQLVVLVVRVYHSVPVILPPLGR